MNGPSLHLSWAEMACRDHSPYPAEWRATRARDLAIEFEGVRLECGSKPLTILSAYRSPGYNARIPGAARNSQHVQGRALDLRPPTGMTVAQLLAAVLRVAARPDSRLKGVGVYRWGIHIDVRPSARLVRWAGSKPVQVAG